MSTASGAAADPGPPAGRAARAARDAIWARIVSGGFPPGSRLGGERDLAEALGLSRSTVRVALRSLEAEGAVQRVPGRGGGTFVRAPLVTRDLSRVSGVPAMLVAQGMRAGSTVLAAGLSPADDTTARALGLAPGALVYSLERVRLADGMPLSLEHARLPAEILPGLLDEKLSGSIYDLLASRYRRPIVRTHESIAAGAASPAEAAALLVPPRAPVLRVTRVGRCADGTAVEFSDDVFRGDRTRVTVRTGTTHPADAG